MLAVYYFHYHDLDNHHHVQITECLEPECTLASTPIFTRSSVTGSQEDEYYTHSDRNKFICSFSVTLHINSNQQFILKSVLIVKRHH